MASEKGNGMPASPKSVSYLQSLLQERDLLKEPEIFDRVNAMDAGEYEAYVKGLINAAPSLDQARVSRMIDKLKALPKVNSADPSGPWEPKNFVKDAIPIPDEKPEEFLAMQRVVGDQTHVVPRGAYAIPSVKVNPNAVNETNFYSVWLKEFDDGIRWTVRQIVSEERYKIPRHVQYKVLTAIAENPGEYAKQYGLLIGKCGVCGRTLTNDESRERGIGPVCASRWGW
jgi:hypothetical protein